MIKIKDLDLINYKNTLSQNKLTRKIYKVFFVCMGISCLLCGLIPSFFSFQRIFYIDDSKIFLILYLTLLTFYIMSSLVFVIVSYSCKVFNKWKWPLIIVFGYLLIFILLSLNAYLFTDFQITETGYEVPFNLLMYVIDVLILFPMYVCFDYYILKFVVKKI